MGERCWGVSTGTYSDYAVRAVFMTEREAEAFAISLRENGAGWSDRDAFVEYLPFNPPLVRRWWAAYGYLKADGTMARAVKAVSRDTLYESWSPGPVPPPNRTEVRVEVPRTHRLNGQAIRVSVGGWDEVTTVRACDDKLSELAALGYETALTLARPVDA